VAPSNESLFRKNQAHIKKNQEKAIPHRNLKKENPCSLLAKAQKLAEITSQNL
jgi:hypothetical protein